MRLSNKKPMDQVPKQGVALATVNDRIGLSVRSRSGSTDRLEAQNKRVGAPRHATGHNRFISMKVRDKQRTSSLSFQFPHSLRAETRVHFFLIISDTRVLTRPIRLALFYCCFLFCTSLLRSSHKPSGRTTLYSEYKSSCPRLAWWLLLPTFRRSSS